MPNLCLTQKIFSNRVDAYPDYIDFTRISVKRLGRGTPDASTFKNRKSMVGCLQEDVPVDQGRNSGTAWVWVYDNSMVPGCATLATYSIDKKDIQVNQDDGTKIFPHRLDSSHPDRSACHQQGIRERQNRHVNGFACKRRGKSPFRKNRMQGGGTAPTRRFHRMASEAGV